MQQSGNSPEDGSFVVILTFAFFFILSDTFRGGTDVVPLTSVLYLLIPNTPSPCETDIAHKSLTTAAGPSV